jgi:hypothetical protein
MRFGDESHCAGCGHELARHYTALDGTARCLVVRSGHSSSGVIGIPWSQDCDCVNQRSESAIRVAERDAYEEAGQREWIDEIKASLAVTGFPAVVVTKGDGPEPESLS